MQILYAQAGDESGIDFRPRAPSKLHRERGAQTDVEGFDGVYANGSARWEARELVALVRKGLDTVENVRRLVAVPPPRSRREAMLAARDPEREKAARYRAEVLAHFERLVAAHEREQARLDAARAVELSALERKAAISAKLKAVWADPVRKEARRQRMLARWRDPAARKKIMDGILSPPNLDRSRQAQLTRWKDPAVRTENGRKISEALKTKYTAEQRSAAMRLSWEKRRANAAAIRSASGTLPQSAAPC